MARVVVFLRGVNVGGHTVKKEDLHRAFAVLGFRDVTTYKQSGNVILKTEVTDFEEIRAKTERKLRDLLGYDVAAYVRTFPHLREVAEKKSHFPLNEGTSLMVTMLPTSTPQPIPRLPLTIPRSSAQVVSVSGSEIFSLTHGGGEGGLPNQFLESKLRAKTTTRNMNVIVEIVQKYG